MWCGSCWVYLGVCLLQIKTLMLAAKHSFKENHRLGKHILGQTICLNNGWNLRTGAIDYPSWRIYIYGSRHISRQHPRGEGVFKCWRMLTGGEGVYGLLTSAYIFVELSFPYPIMHRPLSSRDLSNYRSIPHAAPRPIAIKCQKNITFQNIVGISETQYLVLLDTWQAI